jgi:hypothetical protein
LSASCFCLPFLRWVHRFARPNGVPYQLQLWDKVRNYVIGHQELGLRYREDPAVGTRFETLTRELGDAFIRVEFEGKGHSTLTEHRQQEGVDRVLGFLREHLLSGDAAPPR